MYNDLVKRLRELHPEEFGDKWDFAFACQQAMCEAADAIENTSKAYQMMAEAYEAEVTKQNWIPVTERLPGEREWVLCQCRAKIRMVLRLQNGYWHQDSQHEFMGGFVTHWMPLPPAPKEE